MQNILVKLDKNSKWIAILLSSLYAVAGSIVSVIRYWQYEVFYYDFGIFDKAIWSASRFSAPIIHHMVFGEKIIFADHLSPSIFLLAPLFWIFPHSEMLLVAQATIIATSGFVLFLIGRQLLKNSFYSISIMICYFLFAGLQNAVITDFHEVTLANLLIMLTYLFILKKRKILYFLSFILLLGCKETMFFVGIGISITLWFLQPKWRKIAFSSFMFALIWGFISIKIIIPYFSGGTYLYATQIPTNPIAIVSSFFVSPIKLHTLFFTFLSFGFLPLINPTFLILIFQDFFIRFYPPNFVTRWGLGFHYSSLIAAIMAISSIYSLLWLQSRIKKLFLNIFMIILLLNALFLYRVILHAPFALSYNPAFYHHTKDFAFLNSAVKKIPQNVSIMTQNNLATHFTHQRVWLLISDNKTYHVEYYKLKNPDYILIDNRSGQNPNDFFGIQNMDILLNNLRSDKKYKIFYQKDNLMIFKKTYN